MFGLFRRRPTLTRRASLGARPVRNPAVSWEKTEDGVQLKVPLKPGRAVRTFLRLLRFGARQKLPEYKTIELDETGAFVWEMCDGSRPVKDMVEAVARREKLAKREAEHSVALFLKMLAERKLLLLQVLMEEKKS